MKVLFAKTADGRNIPIEEKELIGILEKRFNCNIEQLSVKEYPNVPPPKEMEWFHVDPCKIDKKLFEEKRVDEEQEKIRQLILEAFDVVEREKEKYGKKFKTYIPLPSFKIDQSLEDVIKEAQEHGDHLADWVEQAMEWGQRIANGEKWETICNEADTIGCYRIIKGKYGGKYKFVGGNCNDHEANRIFTKTPTSISDTYGPNHFHYIRQAKPLVVAYDE